MKPTSTFPCSGAIHILGDEPAGTDELGAHEALAHAIARLIVNEHGGKAIALEGGWGGGKSTVVTLLRQKLTGAHQGRVFVFDGWAHEGDSLRRALVEEFVEWAKREKKQTGQPLVPEASWKRLAPEIEKLQRRRTAQRSKATHRLTALGRLMVVLLALVPVGAVLAARLTQQPLPPLALVLTGLPAALLLLIAILAALTWGGRRLTSAWAGGLTASVKALVGAAKARMHDWLTPTTKASPWHVFDDVLGIFLRQTKERTSAKGWSTAEPSSIEFEGLFRQILREVLESTGRQGSGTREGQQSGERSGNDEEKLVVVLDNLDRLPREEATRAFATLRIFLEERRPDAWMSRFWLLVPYDTNSLRASPHDNSGAQETDPAQELERSFLDKFFQARFRLPQPVLLKWREYLKDRLKQALEGHTDDEDENQLDRIVGLFEKVRKNDLAAPADQTKAELYTFPTPREIKLFVNRLATLHMQWPCEKADGRRANQKSPYDDQGAERIPLVLQAGFALCEARVKNDLSALVHPTSPGRNVLFHDDELRQMGEEGWERHVAAMWYGVPQEEALHMLLRPTLLYAFGVGVVHDHWNQPKLPYEMVRESGLLGTEGLWDVVPVAAQEYIGASDSRTLERCAKTLAVLARWRDEKQPWHDGWTGAWGAVAGDAITALRNERAEVSQESVPQSGENFAAAIAVPQASFQLACAALEALGRIKYLPRDTEYEQWAKQTATLMEAMLEKDKPKWEQSVESFKAPALPKALIFLLGEAYESPRLKEHSPRWAADREEVVTESIMKVLGDAKLQAPPNFPLLHYARAFDILAWTQVQWNWGPASHSLPEWLAEGKLPPSVAVPVAHGLLGVLGTAKLRNRALFQEMRSKRGHIQKAISRAESYLPTVNPDERTSVPELAKLLKEILNALNA